MLLVGGPRSGRRRLTVECDRLLAWLDAGNLLEGEKAEVVSEVLVSSGWLR